MYLKKPGISPSADDAKCKKDRLKFCDILFGITHLGFIAKFGHLQKRKPKTKL